MKKAVAFLLAFLIFVAPMTTFVKADVVIGDNDNIVVNENAKILGRKMAILESFSDLLLSGATDFTISNTNSVDDYIDYLWQEVNDAIDYLDSGQGFEDISSSLQSKYWYNLLNYRDYITNRGDYLSYTLQNPTTSLLQTYFANNIYGKIETSHYDLALDMFKSLSKLNNTNSVNPDPNYEFYIQLANGIQNGMGFFWANYPTYYNTVVAYNNMQLQINYNIYDCSWYCYNLSQMPQMAYYADGMLACQPLTLNINYNGNNYTGVISNISHYNDLATLIYSGSSWPVYCLNFNPSENSIGLQEPQNFPSSTVTYTGTLDSVLSYFCYRFHNINIYVDGVPWAIVSNTSNNPIMDIDGLLKIFGTDNPVNYELQPNTKIDYDQLYQVIYNAIRDNLPISQGDINYYDSHDTIYSPTIINNYGDEEGDESDLIDTILDYAVIPKFDTAIAQPMRAALTNGVVIMNTSITDVIPNEILLILGACFFLLLFAVVINRMIK